MALPENIISAWLLVCERVLFEKDEVLSAIRLVDLFYLSRPLPADLTGPAALPVVTASVMGSIKATPGYSEERTVEIKLVNTSGETVQLTEPIVQPFEVSKEVGGLSAINLVVQINLAVRRLGTCYITMLLDGTEIARTAITLALQSDARV